MPIEAAKLMVSVESNVLKVEGDLENLGKQVDKTSKESSESVGGLKGAFNNLGEGVDNLLQKYTGMNLASFTTIGLIGAMATGLQKAVAAAAESEVVDTRLEAVIKATGGAAGMTATELDKLATETMRLTGLDDELVKNAEAVLLTFRSIGEDVFPQAMRAAADMSAVLGSDLQGSVMQIGKALNDFDGYSALKRAGVSFTDEQEKQIKNFRETNDLIGYQKLVMSELESEFGGAAEAIGGTAIGQWNLFKAELGNIGETIGSQLLPPLTEAVKWINLLISARDRALGTLSEESQKLLDSSLSYEEYAMGMINAGVAAGLLDQKWKDYDEEILNNSSNIQYLSEKIGLLNESSYRAIQLGWGLEDIQKRSALATEENADKVALLTKQEEDLIGVTESLSNARSRMVDATMKVREAEQNWQNTSGNDIVQKLGEAGVKGEDYEKALGAIDEAYGTGFVLQQQYKDDVAALVAEYKQHGDLEKFKTKLNELKEVYMPLAKDVKEAKNEVWWLRHEINMLQSKKITIEMEIIRTEGGGTSTGGGGGGGGGGAQHPPGWQDPGAGEEGIGGAMGLDIVVPEGYPNDTFPVRASSRERVVIIPEGESGRFGSVVFQPGSIQIIASNASDAYEFVEILQNELRRRS